MKDVNVQISERRSKLGFYQSQVGQDSGMTQQMVQRIEAGNDCKLSSLKRTAKALGTDIALVPEEKQLMVDMILEASTPLAAIEKLQAYAKKMQSSDKKEAHAAI
jgi:predicted transcriptional regulator